MNTVLTIAGTDPVSAAGITADLHVFRDFGFHGCSVITAVLAQNTQGVQRVVPMSAEIVRVQLTSVLQDVEPLAIKIGLLPTRDVANAVFVTLEELADRIPIVFDPVLTSGDGKTLLTTEAVLEVVFEHSDQVDVMTPNTPEIEKLTGQTVSSLQELEDAARILDERGYGRLLLKAGHLPAEEDGIRDLWYDHGAMTRLEAMPRIEDDVRGTGCQLASALAVCMLLEDDWLVAANRARAYLSNLLLEHRKRVGRGRPIIVRPPCQT